MSLNPSLLSIFLTHRGELVNYASGIVGDRGSAEDVVQEAYLRFDTTMASPQIEEPVGYLYRIVRNLAIDGRRKRLRNERHVAADGGAELELLAEDRPSPEDGVAAKDEVRIMMAALAELPERTRIALEMHRLGDYKLREIADHLGISVGRAHALVAEGLEHCRKRLCR